MPAQPNPSQRPADALPLAGFDRWLSARSYELLRPICTMSVAVISVLLLAVDPMLFAAGIWGDDPMHEWLVLWHLVSWTVFAAYLYVAAKPRRHRGRQWVMATFYLATGGLFTVFAFISWTLNGDLSTYAIFLLAMACVFAGQGGLRLVLSLTSTLAVAAAIAWADDAGSFLTSGAAINLAALAIVATLLDAFVARLNLALFTEKQRAESQRRLAEQLLHKALPAPVAHELIETRRSRAVRFDNLAVLFIDIVGFTRYCSGRPPEQVLHLLNTLFSTFDRLAALHSVDKIKTMGDAYLAVRQDDLQSVLAMAQDCMHAMGPYRRMGLDIRCGVHAGPAVAGVIGLTRYLYDVWGDAVNIASRMESTGLPGQIQVSDEVAMRMAGQFRFESRGEREIAGWGPMRTHWLVLAQRSLPTARPTPDRLAGLQVP